MEMIARVKALLRRSGGAEESLLTCGNVTLDSEKRMVYVDGKPVELTYKEFELLKLLMKNHGIVISRDVIMERVWDSSFEGESRTIDVHVRTLQAEARRRRRAHQDHPQRRLYGGQQNKVWERPSKPITPIFQEKLSNLCPKVSKGRPESPLVGR